MNIFSEVDDDDDDGRMTTSSATFVVYYLRRKRQSDGGANGLDENSTQLNRRHQVHGTSPLLHAPPVKRLIQQQKIGGPSFPWVVASYVKRWNHCTVG